MTLAVTTSNRILLRIWGSPIGTTGMSTGPAFPLETEEFDSGGWTKPRGTAGAEAVEGSSDRVPEVVPDAPEVVEEDPKSPVSSSLDEGKGTGFGTREASWGSSLADIILKENGAGQIESRRK